jgi:hypothetical protein
MRRALRSALDLVASHVDATSLAADGHGSDPRAATVNQE